MANRRIIEAVLAKRGQMLESDVETGQNQTLAIAAIRGGRQSQEWRAYMMQFVEQKIPGIPVDEAQLKRLLGTDGTLGNPDLDQKRAYMLADGPCGPETRAAFGKFVNTIDQGLEPGCLSADELKEFLNRKKPPKKKKPAKKGGKRKPGYPSK